jgi:hypothetical protein
MKKKVEEETLIYSLEDEKEKSKPYLEKFEKASNFNKNRQEAYAENIAFYQGNQHLLKKYKNETPWVVNMNTPYATIAIDNRVSSILANDYIGDLIPLGEEDVNAVENLDKVYKKEWQKMDLDDVVRSCIRWSAIVREYYCHISLDTKKSTGGKNNKTMGKLEAYAIEPSRVFIDPSARNLKDARFMFVTGRISVEEATELYPEKAVLLKQNNSSTPEERGEVYIDNDYVTEQDDVLQTITYYGKEKGKIKRVDIINNVIVKEKVLDRKTFPIAQMRWKKAAQSCYGLSLMDEVLSLQKAITSIESAITNTAMSYAAPSMMVRKGCGVDPKAVAKAAGAPGVVYSVDGNLDNAIRPVIPPKIQQEILNIKTDFQNQIDKITGNSNQFLGDIGTAGNTSSGANIAVERAKIIEIDVLNNIREFIEDITDIVLEYIITVYSGEKMTYNDGRKPEGGFKFTTIELNKEEELKDANYKYYIELDSKTPYSKERQKEVLLELFQLERQYDTPIKSVTVSDIIQNMDLENKEVIISRFNKLNFQDAQTKADTVMKLSEMGTEFGINPELTNQAISEIIGSLKETPGVDMFMQEVEKAFQQQMQVNEQKIDEATNMLMATPQQQALVQDMASQIENGQPPMM